MISFKEYTDKLMKRTGKKEFLIKNSYTLRESYNWVKKNKANEIATHFTREQFTKVVGDLNQRMREKLAAGEKVIFPKGMGSLFLVSSPANVKCDENGKLKTNRTIDWFKTIELWYNDEEAAAKKTLVRHDWKNIYKIYYYKGKRRLKNMNVYSFIPNRETRTAVYNNIEKEIV